MICSICLSDKHIAASCPYRPRFYDRAIAVVALAFILCGYAWSHDWYDPDCCGGKDCEPVQHVTYVAANSVTPPVMVVTTSLGTKPKTDKTTIRESKDGRMHACIHQDRLWCLYLPPSN